MPENMDHNEFMVDDDLIRPIKAFLAKIQEKEKSLQKIRNQNRSEGSFGGNVMTMSINSGIKRNLLGFGNNS